MKIGIWEFVVIVVVALIVLGPDKLPVYAKKLGQALGEIKKYSNDLSNDIKENIVEPLNEVAQPLKDAVEPINEIQKEIKGTVNDMTKSFNDIGKAKKEESVATAIVNSDEETAELSLSEIQKEEAQTEEVKIENDAKQA